MKRLIALFACVSLMGIGATAFAQDEQPAKPQKKYLSLTFTKQDKETQEWKATWPFATPSKKEVPEDKSEALSRNEELVCKQAEKRGGLEVKFFSKKGIWRDAEAGLGMQGKDGYIEFPAIEGMRIVYVLVLPGVDGTIGEPKLYANNGNIIEPKESETKTGARQLKFSAKGVDYGESCRLVITGKEEFRAKKITVFYRAPKPEE